MNELKKNILVGIDLSEGDQLVADEPNAPSRKAIELAARIARNIRSHVTLFYAIDVSADAQWLIEHDPDDANTVAGRARHVLDSVVQRLRSDGIDASAEVSFGPSWLELIRRVLRAQDDLVIVGAKRRSLLHDTILGNTAIKLLRKCPCPVWVTPPDAERECRRVLVPHCLRDVGDIALRIAVGICNAARAELHVMHALSTKEASKHRIEQVQNSLKDRIDHAAPRPRTTIHIDLDRPHTSILRFIEQEAIDLVVMGTVARTGIRGFITGSTAEWLLPRLKCSVIAVKPIGFVSPVSE